MNIGEVIEKLGLSKVAGDADGSFDGVYAGDFLSRAMSHITEGNLWLTIMNNINVIAVASLTEAAAIILAEGVVLLPDALEAAREKGVVVLSSDKSVYELCIALGKISGAEQS